jgi:CHAT domain-containing protein/tetratricopeptide (TPR) repeat protein
MPAPHRVAPLSCLIACCLLLAAPPLAAQPDAPDADIQRMLDESSKAFAANDGALGQRLAESALEFAVKHERPLLEAEALFRLAKSDAWFRRDAAAIEKFERVRALFERQGNRQREAMAASELAWRITESRGDLTRAVELLESARLTFREINDDVHLAIAGDYLIRATPKGPARDALRTTILAEVRASGGRGVECSILHGWTDELFTAGRYAEAYERATETVHCFEKTTDLGRLGRALVSLGRLERVHGQLDKALANYTRALALQEQVKDEAAALQSLNALATTFSMQGRHEEAKAHYELALARARILGRHDLINALAGNLGGFYLLWGEYEKAASLLEPALREEKQQLFVSVRKRQLANAYQYLGRPDEAMQLMTEACDLAAKIGPEQLFHCMWTRAGIARLQGKLDQADRDLAHVRRIYEEMRANTLPADLMRRGFGQMNQQLYGEVIDLLATRNDGVTALAVSEEGRSRAFLDRLAARGGSAAQTTAAATATTAMATPATATPASVADIKALAKRLQSTWLMYWVGDSDTLIWVVTPEGDVHWQRVPVTLAKIESLVAKSVPRGTALDGLAAVALGSRAHLRPWRELYQLLIKPVSAHLPTAPGARLTIVPHGPLFRLSFAALPDETGKYLLERYDLHYVPAAAVLQFTSAIPTRPALPSLLVGDPASSVNAATTSAISTNGAPAATSSTNGGGTRDATLPELGWARREVTSIAKLLAGDSDTLVGVDATEAAVRRRLTGRRVIHFATHGVVHNDPTMASYLVMQGRSAGSGASDSTGDGAGDGRLTADEIDRFSLDADLVVLSACGTALGPISGDGVQGFTRAFLSAGAGSVIATTWSVADRTTYQVMEGFYRKWLAGRDKARALRESQLAMLRQLRKGGITIDGVVLHESPWLWAGFVLVGNP